MNCPHIPPQPGDLPGEGWLCVKCVIEELHLGFWRLWQARLWYRWQRVKAATRRWNKLASK